MDQRNSFGLAIAIAAAWILFIFLLAPMLIVVPYSLTPERYLSMPDGQYSTRHYATIFFDSAWLNALTQSILVGVCAMIVATLIGGAAAIGLWQMSRRLARWIGALALLPMIVPPIVTAVALSRTWINIGIYDTFAGVVFAHAIIGMPFVFMTISASLDSLDPRIAQAARSLGSGPFRTVRDVVLPNIKPGMITGALFAFFTSWDEVVVTTFVSSRSVFTLPRKIWTDIRDNIDPAVAAISTLMIAITTVVAIIYLARDLRRIRSKGTS